MKSTPATTVDETVVSESKTPANRRLKDQLEMLGIADAEVSPEVTLAVSALLEKVDDLNRELARTKDHLAEIERLVDVDCLVPLPNRRAFMRRLAWAISMYTRYSHPSAILYFDINDFKVINDTYGHAAGDIAIRHVSQILTSSLRESDFVARIGGDEFAIIMYHAGEDAAKKRGRKICDTIHNTPLVLNGEPVTLTCAFGSHAVKKNDDAETSLAAADIAMYVDKKRSKPSLIEAKA